MEFRGSTFGLYYKLVYICIVITGGSCPCPSGRAGTGSESKTFKHDVIWKQKK